MEKRIRPWINKKIVEYIGEEEATLVDFVCSKVRPVSSLESEHLKANRGYIFIFFQNDCAHILRLFQVKSITSSEQNG